MNEFTTTGKATIEIFCPHPVPRLEVTDSKGSLYFFRNMKGQQRLKFNIAKADTFKMNVDCDSITVLPLSIHPLKTFLPLPDRDYKPEFKVVLNTSLTGTPARNFFKKGIIEVSPAFYKQPYPIRIFILLHEIGHFKYKDESSADIWAAQEFIKMGYNNSSAFYALHDVLDFHSEVNKQRLTNLFKILHR